MENFAPEEGFKEYQQCVEYIQNNPKMGELAYQQAKSGFSMPTTSDININKNNIDTFEVKPGRYKVPGKDSHISVQYDNLIKGKYFEAWHPDECEPRRKLDETEVKEMVKKFYSSV